MKLSIKTYNHTTTAALTAHFESENTCLYIDDCDKDGTFSIPVDSKADADSTEAAITDEMQAAGVLADKRISFEFVLETA